MFPYTKHDCSRHCHAGAIVEAARVAELPRDGIPERQGWRDQRLVRLAAHKRDAAAS